MYKMDFELGNTFKTMNLLKEEKMKIDQMTQPEKEEYKVDPRKFNKLRLKQIERVYGEHGQEMLRLLPKNPTKAIPVLYERFRNNYENGV